MCSQVSELGKVLKNLQGVYDGCVLKDDDIQSAITEGSEDKYIVILNDEKYIMKDSSWNRRRKQVSYAPYCEYVGSHIFEYAGVPVHKTFLAKYKDRDVVLCKNLFGDGEVFRPFRDIHQSSAGTDLSTKSYTYEDVLYVIDKIYGLEGRYKDEALYQFWMMFLIDSIIGNRDRHEGNWGFVKTNGIVKISPVFDNGSSLFPDVKLSNWKAKDFLEYRVFYLPASQFKAWKENIGDRPMRTNFNEVIQYMLDSDSNNEYFQRAFSFISQIDISKAITYATAQAGLNKELREWFISIIFLRFNCLIRRRPFDEVYEELQEVLR